MFSPGGGVAATRERMDDQLREFISVFEAQAGETHSRVAATLEEWLNVEESVRISQ